MALEPFEDALHIGQVINEVGQKDVVEFILRRERLVGGLEFKGRVFYPRLVYQKTVSIDPDTARRFHGGEKIARSTPEVQDPDAGGHQEGVIKAQEPVVSPIGGAGAQRRTALVKALGLSHLHFGRKKRAKGPF